MGTGIITISLLLSPEILTSLPSAQAEIRPRLKRRSWNMGRHIPSRRFPLRLARLKDSYGLKVRRAKTAWGLRFVLRRLHDVARAYQQQFPDAEPLGIHDLSLRHGGRMIQHRSHREGRDVDIRLILKHPTSVYGNVMPQDLHVERMWFLISLFVETCDVEFILLDRSLQKPLHEYARQIGEPEWKLALFIEYPHYPSNPRANRRYDAIVRHFSNHANHLHVRFRWPTSKLQTLTTRQYCEDRHLHEQKVKWAQQ